MASMVMVSLRGQLGLDLNSVIEATSVRWRKLTAAAFTQNVLMPLVLPGESDGIVVRAGAGADTAAAIELH